MAPKPKLHPIQLCPTYPLQVAASDPSPLTSYWVAKELRRVVEEEGVMRAKLWALGGCLLFSASFVFSLSYVVWWSRRA